MSPARNRVDWRFGGTGFAVEGEGSTARPRATGEATSARSARHEGAGVPERSGRSWSPAVEEELDRERAPPRSLAAVALGTTSTAGPPAVQEGRGSRPARPTATESK